MNKIDVNLYGAQKEIWDAMLNSHKNVIAVVPVGSGKTFLASMLLPIAATTPTMHKGRSIVYAAPSHPMIERIMWQPLKKVCMEHFGLEDEKHINNSKKTITFPGAQQIMCLSAETGLKGINAGLIVCDEAAEFKEEALQELTNRIRPAVGDPTSGGRMILISTPEGKNAFHKMFEQAQLDPEHWIVIHLTYKQMRSQSKKWIETQRGLLSPLKFNRDMLCDWGSVEDQFFYTWKKAYLTDQIADRGKLLYSFNDFNKKRMCCMIAQVTDGDIRSSSGKIEILKSYAITDCGTEQLAQAIRRDFPQRTIHTIMDRSGNQTNRDTTSVFGITDQTILEKYGFRIINNAKSNPFISDTDNSCNAFINQGRLAVSFDDRLTIEALETFHYEDGTRKQLVKYKEANQMHIDGLGDCLRYGIHHLFPMQHTRDDRLPEYIDSEESYYVAPGAEYMDQSEALTVSGVPTIKGILARMNADSEETW